AVPDLTTWLVWGIALVAFLAVALLRPRLNLRIVSGLILLFTVGELWLASSAMPYNDLVAPDAYTDGRMSVYQLKAYQEAECPVDTTPEPGLTDSACPPPGRMLSISNGYFDPGDKANMTQRYADLGLTERATRYAFVAAKNKELITPNLPMVWGIPSVDGAGGGILPTLYYTQFTSLLLPEGMPRTLDGRLRELLAQQTPACNGACIPDQRWLNLTNTRYLILDKVYDLWQDGIAYDTAFTLKPGESFPEQSNFVGTALNLLYTGSDPQIILDDGSPLIPADLGTVGNFKLAQITLDAPRALQTIRFESNDVSSQLHALTLVDTRTGDFMQLPLGPWRLALSSDIKLYENLDLLPRAFVVLQASFVPDTWGGTETALTQMRDPAFDPTRIVMLSGEAPDESFKAVHPYDASLPPVTILNYRTTHIDVQVNTLEAGYLLLTDAWYPGWQVTVSSQPATLYRADVMFRAVSAPAGQTIISFDYAPSWLSWIFTVTMLAWVIVVGFVTLAFLQNRRRTNHARADYV
ncbi:MAG TPA: hypothetical protein VHL11_08380, partial [Phototrophicaceae bacterium]|nr:hypothetical protein [Phototrophicaceae bacterium]